MPERAPGLHCALGCHSSWMAEVQRTCSTRPYGGMAGPTQTFFCLVTPLRASRLSPVNKIDKVTVDKRKDFCTTNEYKKATYIFLLFLLTHIVCQTATKQCCQRCSGSHAWRGRARRLSRNNGHALSATRSPLKRLPFARRTLLAGAPRLRLVLVSFPPAASTNANNCKI